ncbi:MAG TPA: aminopeptidase P N-terminal domain-containing protein [Candidatus Baltobacteraceae bacterium]|nr:aminopeptidase P N-terminal domain-containing protein [Candidatus Baltobacteraceae bacterium]
MLVHPYSERRARLMEQLGGATAVIPSARLSTRSADTEYAFRQDSDFFYLTGFDEPDAVLVLAPSHAREQAVLFLRPRDRTGEIWNGVRLGVQSAPAHLGLDAAFSIDELPARLPEYLGAARTLYYEIGRDERLDRTIREALDETAVRARRKGRVPAAIVQPGELLHEMRLRKEPAEIEAMRGAAAATAQGHLAGMRATRPDAMEYEIKAAIEYEYYRRGGEPAYQSIVAAGDNATVLHYTAVRSPLRDGELLLVDSGCELNLYACDVTRTWPVNGRFTAEQRAIYEIVLAAQEAGIQQVRTGKNVRAFHDACVRTITEGLIEIGLLTGGADENIENERFRNYYMHGSGHWIGLDVHDVGRYRDDADEHRLLEPGMVTTVEPGIYVHRDLDCDERFKGIGVRIEDDVLVTQTGNEVLTSAIPKRVADVEAAVKP